SISSRICLLFLLLLLYSPLFFFTAPATTEIYTLSLHDALPIYPPAGGSGVRSVAPGFSRGTTDPAQSPARVAGDRPAAEATIILDRKSTRLNSSHDQISYAVFCLKKKKKT